MAGIFSTLSKVAVLCKEDWETNGRRWSSPGFQALLVYRSLHHLRAVQSPIARLLRVPIALAYLFVRNIYGIELPPKAVLGRRLKISHQGCIVLNQGARLGDDCRIRHCVTIGGMGSMAKPERRGQPWLGDNVYLSVGATVLGPVNLGNGCLIGPHALVMDDVPEDGRAYGPKATIVSTSQSELSRGDSL